MVEYQERPVGDLQDKLLLHHLPIDGERDDLINRLERLKDGPKSILDDLDGTIRQHFIQNSCNERIEHLRGVFDREILAIEKKEAKLEVEYQTRMSKIHECRDVVHRQRVGFIKEVEDERSEKLEQLERNLAREQRRVFEIVVPVIYQMRGIPVPANGSAVDDLYPPKKQTEPRITVASETVNKMLAILERPFPQATVTPNSSILTRFESKRKESPTLEGGSAKGESIKKQRLGPSPPDTPTRSSMTPTKRPLLCPPQSRSSAGNPPFRHSSVPPKGSIFPSAPKSASATAPSGFGFDLPPAAPNRNEWFNFSRSK